MEQRLIDANKLERWLKTNMANENPLHCDIKETYSECITMVHCMETVDAVPVVHGRWVETGKVFVHSMYDLFTKCSLCSFGHVRNEYQEPYRFCPNCGAKMDAKDMDVPTKDGGAE